MASNRERLTIQHREALIAAAQAWHRLRYGTHATEAERKAAEANYAQLRAEEQALGDALYGPLKQPKLI